MAKIEREVGQGTSLGKTGENSQAGNIEAEIYKELAEQTLGKEYSGERAQQVQRP